MEFDLVLLHPPSFYDFRKNNQFRGPISDVVPSSSVFDMYPIAWSWCEMQCATARWKNCRNLSNRNTAQAVPNENCGGR